VAWGGNLLKLLGILFFVVAMATSAFSATPDVAPTDDPEMQFFVVRATLSGCEPDCPEWIQGQGRIASTSVAKLKALLTDKSNRNLPLFLHSGGGDINAALQMGRVIRQYKMTTTIGRTLFTLCDPYRSAQCRPSVSNKSYRGIAMDYGAKCMSACPLLLLGGSQRLVSPNAFLGLHQPVRVDHPYIDRYWETYRLVNGRKVIISKKFVKRITLAPKKVVGVDNRLRNYLAGYIKEMNGSVGILDEMQKADPTNIYKIQESDVRNLGLATSTDTLDAFSRIETCNASALPSYCVVIK
jgi:hypothetical protein